MMTYFFTVRNNSNEKRGFPWIMSIVTGKTGLPDCPECGESPGSRFGDLLVALERDKGVKWPDVIGCGAEPLLIVSERVLADWRSEKVGEFPVGGRVSLAPPFPARLQEVEPPKYFWLDGAQCAVQSWTLRPAGSWMFVSVLLAVGISRTSPRRGTGGLAENGLIRLSPAPGTVKTYLLPIYHQRPSFAPTQWLNALGKISISTSDSHRLKPREYLGAEGLTISNDIRMCPGVSVQRPFRTEKREPDFPKNSGEKGI